jgi:hypothetical protein
MIAICLEVDHTTAAGTPPVAKTEINTEEHMGLDEGGSPTTLVLGVEIYVTFVDHPYTSL